MALPALLNHDCLGVTLQFLEDARDLFSFCLVAKAWNEAYKDCKLQLMEHKYWCFRNQVNVLRKLCVAKNSLEIGHSEYRPGSGYYRLLTEAKPAPENIAEIFTWSPHIDPDFDFAQIDHWMLAAGQVTTHFQRITRKATKSQKNTTFLDIYSNSETLGKRVHCVIDFYRADCPNICQIQTTIDPLFEQYYFAISFTHPLLKSFPESHIPTSEELISYIDAHMDAEIEKHLNEPIYKHYKGFDIETGGLEKLALLTTEANKLWVETVLRWRRIYLDRKLARETQARKWNSHVRGAYMPPVVLTEE